MQGPGDGRLGIYLKQNKSKYLANYLLAVQDVDLSDDGVHRGRISKSEEPEAAGVSRGVPHDRALDNVPERLKVLPKLVFGRQRAQPAHKNLALLFS